jgi:hypothetical protein
MEAKYFSMYLWTSIGRPVHPRYPTNLAIMVCAAVAGGIAGSLRLVTSGGDLGASILAGIYMGAAIFIAWSLTREADPEHDMAAFVSSGVAFVLALLWGAPPLNLVALGTLIVFLRLINRIVGPPFRWIDTIGSMALVLFLAWQGEGLLVLFLAAAYLIDAVLKPTPLQRHIPFALISAGIGVFVLMQQGLPRLTPSVENIIVGGTVLMAFLIFLLTRYKMRLTTDAPGYTTTFERNRASLVWLFLIGTALMIFGGDAGMREFLPLWGMFAGPLLYALGMSLAARANQPVVAP